jgi:hypothetical protein
MPRGLRPPTENQVRHLLTLRRNVLMGRVVHGCNMINREAWIYVANTEKSEIHKERKADQHRSVRDNAGEA